MSLNDANWQDVTTGNASRQHAPQLTVRPSRDGYINKAADLRWFEGYDHVRFQVDPDQHLIRLIPETESSPRTVRIIRDGDHGGEVSLKSTLRHLDVDVDTALNETVHAEIEEVGDLLVADISDYLQVQDDVVDEAECLCAHDTLDAGDDCPDCDYVAPLPEPEPEADDEPEPEEADEENPHEAVREWATEKVSGGDQYSLESRQIAEEIPGVSSRQVGQYLGQLTDDDSADVDVKQENEPEWTRARWRVAPPGSLDEDRSGSSGSSSTSDDPDTAAIVEAAERDDITSVHELGEALGLEKPGRSRTLAKKAGCYSELDDAPEQGGYGRPGGA